MTKNWMWIAVVAASTLFTGCSPETVSLHPIYNDQDVVFEEAMLGTWHQKDEWWRFERDGDTGYRLFLGDEKEAIKCRLVRLSNYLFLDVISWPGHDFLRVELAPDSLRLAEVDSEWIKAKLTKENALPFERVRDGKQTQLVIRASTEDMQHFLLTNALNEAAFPKWTELKR